MIWSLLHTWRFCPVIIIFAPLVSNLVLSDLCYSNSSFISSIHTCRFLDTSTITEHFIFDQIMENLHKVAELDTLTHTRVRITQIIISRFLILFVVKRMFALLPSEFLKRSMMLGRIADQ